jgi:hypothetical protein
MLTNYWAAMSLRALDPYTHMMAVMGDDIEPV